MGHSVEGEEQFVQMVLRYWTRWPPCPYMVKTLKIFFSRTRKALGLNPDIWHLDARPTKLIQMMILGWPLTFLRCGQIFVLVDVAILEECCMISAYMHWLFYSRERIVAHGSLFFFLFCTKLYFFFFFLIFILITLDWQMANILLFFQENRIWHFMYIVSLIFILFCVLCFQRQPLRFLVFKS